MTRFIRIVALLWLLPLTAIAGEIAVVVNDPALASALTEADVKQLYTGHAEQVKAPFTINVLDYRTDLDLRDGFYRKLTRRSGRQMYAFWMQFIFSGAGRGPTFVADEAEMLRTLESSPRSIGYVDIDSVPDTLLIVARISTD